MPIPKILRSEYATVLNDITNPYPMYGGRLDPQDETLIKRGGLALSYKIYEELLADTHCSAVMQKRVSAVVGREWEVVPASKRAIDKKAADMVRAHLEALDSRGIVSDKNETILDTGSGFDQVSADQMWSIFYGFSVNEIVWDQDGKEVFPSKIPRRDIRRFCFRTTESGQFALRLMTPSSRWEGEALPPRKFIVQRFNGGALAEDPYGLGIASKLWYPVYFKRQSGQFWLIFADKWASPTAVAKYAKGTSDEQKDTLLQMLQAIATDAGIVIPDTVAIEFLEAQRTGTINCYKDLIEFCNNEISKAVLGETGTTDQSTGGGSRARDQIGNEVRIEIAKYDADMLSLTLNRSLVRWIVDFNLPGAKPPKVWRKFPELDNKIDRQAEAGIIQTLVTAGFTPKRDWVAERMEVELEDKEPGAEDQMGVDVTGDGIPDNADTPPDLGALLSGDAGGMPADGEVPIDGDTPVEQEQPTEDLNGDGVIDESDIPPDLADVGQTPTEDINGDGVIDESDIPPDLTGVGETSVVDEGNEEDETDVPPDLGFTEPKKSKKRKQAKFRKVMHEFKTGKLKSSSGDLVKSRKQAIAIALSVSQDYAEGDLTTIDQLVATAERELKPEIEKWIKQISRWAKPLPQDVAIERITEELDRIDKTAAIDDLTTLLIESEYLGRSDAADQLKQLEPEGLDRQIEDEYSELAAVIIALLLANLAKDLMLAWESGSTDTIAIATSKGWMGENAFRIALIASQNLFSAWRSGHWAVQSTNLTHPYLMWKHDEPMQPRPQHVALDRLVLPVSDPFWKYCYPGCDWGCRCVAIPLTEADLKRRKLQVGTPPSDTTEMRDIVTGEIARIPKVGGIPIASPAFVYSRDTTPKRRAEVILRSGYEGLPDVLRYYLVQAIGFNEDADFADRDYVRDSKGRFAKHKTSSAPSLGRLDELEESIFQDRKKEYLETGEYKNILIRGRTFDEIVAKDGEKAAKDSFDEYIRKLAKHSARQAFLNLTIEEENKKILNSGTDKEKKELAAFNRLRPDLKKSVTLSDFKKQNPGEINKLVQKYDQEIKLDKLLSLDETLQRGKILTKDLDAELDLLGQYDGRLAVMAKFRESLIQDGMDRQSAENLVKSKKFDSSLDLNSNRNLTIDTAVEFYQITNGLGSKTLNKFESIKDRAYASKVRGTIDVGVLTDESTVFHEMGHHVEFEDQRIAFTARQWRNGRSTGNPTPLKEITGWNYNADEIAHPGRYFNPYVGKVYDAGITEVISMGLGQFSSPQLMLDFYEQDKEHFQLTMGIIRRK